MVPYVSDWVAGIYLSSTVPVIVFSKQINLSSAIAAILVLLKYSQLGKQTQAIRLHQLKSDSNTLETSSQREHNSDKDKSSLSCKAVE